MDIRIGGDGAIIKDNEVISDSDSVIREDGTIESTHIESDFVPRRNYVSYGAPVSPLENGVSRQNTQTTDAQQPVAQPIYGATTATSKSIADLEYDLMVAEGHVRGSVPKTPIIVTIFMLFCGIFIHPAFFIGVVIAGAMVFMGFSIRAGHEENVQRLKREIELAKQQRR